jgi:hypothetical protein
MWGWRGIAAACLAVALTTPAAHAEPAAAPQAVAGTTLETAIVLPGIADDFHGVTAEHAYIAAHFDTWHIENQERVEANGRNYDRIGMIRPDGVHTAIFFDITKWIGK